MSVDAGETGLCPACSSVGLQRADFERSPFGPDQRYLCSVLRRTLGSLRRSTGSCPLCRLIAYILDKDQWQMNGKSDDTMWELVWTDIDHEYDPSDANGQRGSGLYPRIKASDIPRGRCIQLVDHPSTNGFLRGRLVSKSINYDLIRSWLRRCAEKHGKDCVSTYFQLPPHPARQSDFMVIDVALECLVNLPPEESYVALSYVWGQANHLTTIKSNVSEYQKPGAFTKRMPPKTIQDAIHLTRALKFKYLWIDALCIVQDDHKTKGLLISNMDAVYGHAALTIVAASAIDADAGLQGWRSNVLERQLCIENMGPNWNLGVISTFDEPLKNSPHAKRAWTYQEGCLSPRCLVILEGLAIFSCRGSVWREDVMAEIDHVKHLEGSNILGRTSSPWPLERFGDYVRVYTSRQLTYQSDALNAFNGIAKAVAPSMANTRVFYGMPAAVFDWALLWTGNLDLKVLKRRQKFPSWSWVGWQGEIRMAPGTYSSSDQEWLLKRTWIDWYLVLENGDTVLVWDPKRDESTISPLIEDSSNFHDPSSPRPGSGHAVRETRITDAEDDGTEAIDSDDDEGIDICPTYGEPSLSNAYGRTVEPHLLSVLPPLPVLARSESQPRLHATPGTLLLSTVVTRFALEPENSISKYGTRFFRLHDSAHRVCGIILDDSEQESPPKITIQIRELLLISEAFPGSFHMVGWDEVGFAEEYRQQAIREQGLNRTPHMGKVKEEMLGDWHTSSFFNVLLVRQVQEQRDAERDQICTYEREGIGILLKGALTHALEPEPHWQTVLLS